MKEPTAPAHNMYSELVVCGVSPMAARIKGKDILLLLLYLPGYKSEICEPIPGRTMLQKMVFLFVKELLPKFRRDLPITGEDMPQFEAWRFGPFSRDVFDDVEFLTNIGFIRVLQQVEASEPEDIESDVWQDTVGDIEGGECSTEVFSLSGVGRDYVTKRLLAVFSDNQKQALEALKRNCLSAGLKGVLRYVYTKYPAETEKSEIRDRVMGPVR